MKQLKVTILCAILCAFVCNVQAQDNATTSKDLSGISLRTNVAYWMLLTPNLGIEYRPNNDYGLLLNGAFARWDWKNDSKHHRLWQVNPQARRYMGAEKDSYVGLEYQMGQYNFTGRQGNFMGGGLALGHQFHAGKNLMLDLGFSLGYLHLSKKERYEHINGVDVRDLNTCKSNGYWGPTGFQMTFVWKIN